MDAFHVGQGRSVSQSTWANISNLVIYHLYISFECFPNFYHMFPSPMKSKKQGHLETAEMGKQQSNNARNISCHEPALKSYSEACNRDWFWSADLPHAVWKKYWQSILHWVKIIATVPLPCSNLPLDHSRQGHRVHYTEWSEGGTAGHWDV